MNPTTMNFDNAKEFITSNSGLVHIGRMLNKLGLDDLNTAWGDATYAFDIANRDVLSSLVGILALGRSSFTDLAAFANDPFFKQALGMLAMPSENTVRDRLKRSEGKFDPVLARANTAAVAAGKPTAILVNGREYMPVDADVSILDNTGSKKEGVSRTYHSGVDGFAPMFAYVGSEGFMLHHELRPGSQHCQSGTPKFLAETLRLCATICPGVRPLVRLDAGNDAAENLRVMDLCAEYIIKRNLRQESLTEWLTIAQSVGAAMSPRAGKTVWVGSVRHVVEAKGDKAKGQGVFLRSVRVVFEVTERTINAKGEKLLIPDIEVNTWNTSLEDVSELEIIALYHDHGTSEQFHSEFKSDMGIERLPSGKLAVNRTVMMAAMLAYNLLRRLGKEMLEAMPEPGVARRRLRTVINDFMHLAAKVVSKARRVVLKFSRDYQLTKIFGEIYAKC